MDVSYQNSLSSPQSSKFHECPVCFDDFDVPKVFSTCGHSICAKCEARMLEIAPLKSGKKTILCPVCRKAVSLASGEYLPVNYSLKGRPNSKILVNLYEKDIVERIPKWQTMTRLTQSCHFCRTRIPEVNALCCVQCQLTLCGLCAFEKHNHHRDNIQRASYVTDAEKEAAISKLAVRVDVKLMEESIESLLEQAAQSRANGIKILKDHLIRFDFKAAEIRENLTMTKGELAEKESELRLIADFIAKELSVQKKWSRDFAKLHNLFF